MKVFVTGTDGYIGGLLGPMLLDRGHDVVGCDVGLYKDGWLYDGVEKFPTHITKDIRLLTVKDLEGFDAVIHLAELSNDPLGEVNPQITYKINHLGSVELAKNSKLAGIKRFVYTSSCSVYGAGSGDIKTEDSDPNPQTAYAECKVLVERDVSLLADRVFSPTFLRNATAYGPSPRMRFDLVLNDLVGMAWNTHKIEMSSDGTPWRPLVHVLDICQAIACALEAPLETVHNQVFNVGANTENYQIRDLAEAVSKSLPGCEVSFGDRGGDNRSYRVCFDKINGSLPGFECRGNVISGVEELLDVFHKINFTAEMFHFRAYTRLRQLKYLIQMGLVDEEFFLRQPVGLNVC